MKHSNVKKLFAACLTAVLLGTALVSCGNQGSGDGAGTSAGGNNAVGTTGVVTLTPEEYEKYSFADVQSAFPDIEYVFAFDHGDQTTGDTVSYDEYRYYQLLYKNYFDNGKEEYWTTNPEMKANVTDMYLREIRRNHAVQAECARYGISLSEGELLALDRKNAEFVAAFGGLDTFREALDMYYMTEYFFAYQGEMETLYSKLDAYYRENGQILTNQADIRAMLDTDAYVCAKHILIKNDAGEDAAKNLALAQDILSRLNNGEDFDTLMNQYNEDPGMKSEPNGYHFFRGEMVKSFEDAAFALEVGQISD
ncbi:MAG: peptidylprolyl isomerase, partial [Clostridia bacterium]|nr:peptidylprolyl isomerase [Clostridia bacterium]